MGDASSAPRFQIDNMWTAGKQVWFVDRWVGDGWKNLEVLGSERDALALVARLEQAAGAAR